MVGIIWIKNSKCKLFYASKYGLYAGFSGDIIASYDAEFGASKDKLYPLQCNSLQQK